jgi:prephenate dehydratase
MDEADAGRAAAGPQGEPRVGYQGEAGAFSEDAAGLLFPGAVAVPHRAFRSIFVDVQSGRLSHGVVPLENALAGSINETYDLLGRGGVWIVAEVVVRVEHSLLALPGTLLKQVWRVASHPQALAQCQEFLAELDAEVVPEYDTAGAARRIALERRPGEAAVASARAAEVYGLEILARGIQTDPRNQTRFAAISADPTPLGPEARTSLVFGTTNEPGALYRVLGHLAGRGLNLSKLESRPLGDEPWQYRFYLDVDAGVHEPPMADAIEAMAGDATFLRVLGSYPRWRDPDPPTALPR